MSKTRPRARGRVRARGALVALVAALGGSAGAHIVVGTPTLSLLTATSEVVVVARIVDPDAVLSLEEAGLREQRVVAEVLEVLKGELPPGPLRFVQHGHGVARYHEGDVAAVFLQPLDRLRELARSPLAGHVDWVSLQETDTRFVLAPETREGFAAAVRRYAALPKLATPEARSEALRRITLDLLASQDPTLARSALRDVVLARDAPILTAGDLPRLEPLLGGADTPIGIRVGLLAELERRGLVDGPPRWAKLLRTTTGSDRFAVVRAAAAHPSTPVHAELEKLLGSEDRQLAAAAAVALGVPGNDAAVEPLAKLLDDAQERVRMAAIRGMGRIATPAARRALAEAAASHPKPATRRRAAAEVAILGGTVSVQDGPSEDGGAAAGPDEAGDAAAP